MTTDARPTATQRELLAIMRDHNIAPSLRMRPGACIRLPEPHESAWRKKHGGKPVLSSVMAGLERRGLVVVTDTNAMQRGYRWWKIAR